MDWQEITKTNSLAISERMLSEAISVFRLDAEYFQPHYIENDAIIANKPHQILDEVLEDIKSFGAYSLTNQISYQDSGIPFIRCTDVKGGYVDFSQVLFINEDSNKLLWKSAVEPGTVILCMSGSVGNCAVAEEGWAYPINSNQDVAKITLKKGYDPYYVSAFFNSKYGRLQILRLPIGSVQQHIFLWQLKTLKVPQASEKFQRAISSVYRKSLERRKLSEEAFKNAEKILEKELNLEGYIPSEKNVSVRNLSDCIEHNRIDAEYWEPKYDEMQSRVSSIPQKSVGDFVSMKKGIDPGSAEYTDKGVPFVRVADISIYGIEEGDKKISPKLYAELQKNYQPKKGEILFTKDGTIGISYALDEDVEGIVSGAFLRFSQNEVNNKYLALVLNSPYCKFQIKRMSGGAIIAHLKPDDVKKIKVPILPEDIQEALGNKVSEAFQFQKEAKKHFEDVKQGIEIFIEKNEAEAISYLASQSV